MHRRRYTVARGRLRELLADRAGMAPGELEFAYTGHGKPAWRAPAGRRGLQFNVSHSGERCLIGITDGPEIGVDIEMWRQLSDEAALARRYFAPAEVAAYDQLDPSRRSEGFFNCWTRKEAYVKAVGKGLSLPLDSFAVSLAPGAPARILSQSDLLHDERRWSLAAVEPVGAASAALVVGSELCAVRAG